MPTARPSQHTADARESDEHAFLSTLGTQVRAAREAQRLSRRALASAAEVSERYLAQLESGQGNVSVLLLRRIANALSLNLAGVLLQGPHADAGRELLTMLEGAPREQREALMHAARSAASAPRRQPCGIALIGLRGAGKSTLGREAASTLGLEFCELNDRISESSGLGVAEIFNLYGAEGYRRLERRCLETVIERAEPVLLATGGGIVTAAETLELLLERFFTVWVRAEPEQHMQRVRAQGDTRPMDGHAQAMEELRNILAARSPLYARADRQLDTSGRSVENCARALVELLVEAGYGARAREATMTA